MNPIQLIQKKLGLNPDGQIGRITFGAMVMHWKLTPIQLAHFLGQCDHETGGFNVWQENLNYSKESLLKVFKTRYTPELAQKHERKPTVIANHVYGNRMGNVNPNDGWLFRGRGAIQLTGRINYQKFSKYIKDLLILESPDLVSGEYAFDSALWFFKMNNIFNLCNDLSEESILTVSRGINLGNPLSTVTPNGMPDRIEKTIKYSKFIT